MRPFATNKHTFKGILVALWQDFSITNLIWPDFKIRKFRWTRCFQQFNSGLLAFGNDTFQTKATEYN